MTMPRNTINEGLKNKCCKDVGNLEHIQGDGWSWEEYLCNECGLEYQIPLELQRFFEDAELIESSIKPSQSWVVNSIESTNRVEIYDDECYWHIFADSDGCGYWMVTYDFETMEIIDSECLELDKMIKKLSNFEVPNKHIKKAIKLMKGAK